MKRRGKSYRDLPWGSERSWDSIGSPVMLWICGRPIEEMVMSVNDDPTRRFLLARAAVIACGIGLSGAELDAAAATPACHDGDEPTLRETEGPYFRPHSPERSDLREAGISGRPIELSGSVLTRSCQPIERALVDLWHANDRGDYDNRGFKLRGHVFTDAAGRYRFRTIMPGPYAERTRHYHVKVQAPGRSVLTTQFYFPDEPRNKADGLFRRELVMRVAETEDGLAARFDVVLDIK
jgi:protocatechuate 3,4-dioxygenase beta subunit